MRALTFLVMLLLVSSAWAQSQDVPKQVPPITEKAKGADKPKDDANNKQTVTVEFPPSVNIIVGGKLDVKTENQNAKRHDEGSNAAEWLIAAFTGVLVLVTGYLAHYTKQLWGSTVIAPHDTHTIRLEIPDLEASALVDDHTALYIRGEIRYFDGFKPNRMTKIHFRRVGGHDWQREGDMETCPEGNDIT